MSLAGWECESLVMDDGWSTLTREAEIKILGGGDA